MSRFQDKVAVVTGGSSGIGLATAKAFALEGARVIIAGRSAESLAAAAIEIGGDVTTYQLDVSSVSSIRQIFSAIIEKFGTIDALFVNAGASSMIPLENVTEADWDKIHTTNLKGVFFTIQSAVPAMRAGAAIVSEEALIGSAITKVRQVIERQPPWSDFPLILLTVGGAVTAESERLR